MDKVRQFNTGATRDQDKDKLDIEAFISPITILRYCEYMHKHRVQPDGTQRAGDNWQKGMPKDVYAKSLLRHVLDFWLLHRNFKARESMMDALCGILFNTFGYMYELEKEKQNPGVRTQNRFCQIDSK